MLTHLIFEGLARTYVVSTMAVAIAPHLSVASAVISPPIALVLAASVGKVALNAWCATPNPSFHWTLRDEAAHLR
jgi:hypothetical protein